MNRRPALGWALDHVALAAFYLYFCAFTIYYIADSSPALRVAQLLGLGVFTLESARYLPGYRPVYWILLASCAAYLVKVIAYGSGDLDVLVYVVTGAGMAMVLYRHEPDPRALWVIYGGVLAYFGLAMLRGTHPLFTMAARSYNHISVLAIAYGVMLTLLYQQRGEPARWGPAVATFLLSLWGMGRAGILASALLLVGVAVLRRDTLRTRAFWLWLGAGGIAGAWLVRSTGLRLTDMLAQFTWKFAERGLLDPARAGILRGYLGSLDGTTFLLGHEERIIETLRLTLHNSFLLWHFYFGVTALLLLAFTGLALVRTVRARPVVALCLLVVLLRSATDTVLYPGPLLDGAFLYILMTALARQPTPAPADDALREAAPTPRPPARLEAAR